MIRNRAGANRAGANRAVAWLLWLLLDRPHAGRLGV